MGAGGDDGVGEVVGVAVAFVAEVEPGVAVLMDEEGIGGTDVVEPREMDDRPRPRVPAGRIDGMRGRTDGKQVEHHVLAIMVPPCWDELPISHTHRKHLVAVEHPGPVDAFVDRGGKADDLGIVMEVSPSGEDTAEQKRGIDGGYFAIAPGHSGFDVVEVAEEAVLAGKFVAMEAERAAYLLDDLCMGLVVAFVRDAEGGEAKPAGGDACNSL